MISKKKKVHRSNKKPSQIVEAAKEHIQVYFEQAEKKYDIDPKLSHRYVQLGRKIAMKFKVPLTNVQKRKFCKHCYHFLMPGKNARVRTKEGKVVYYCLDCKKFSKVGFQNEEKSKKSKKE